MSASSEASGPSPDMPPVKPVKPKKPAKFTIQSSTKPESTSTSEGTSLLPSQAPNNPDAAAHDPAAGQSPATPQNAHAETSEAAAPSGHPVSPPSPMPSSLIDLSEHIPASEPGTEAEASSSTLMTTPPPGPQATAADPKPKSSSSTTPNTSSSSSPSAPAPRKVPARPNMLRRDHRAASTSAASPTISRHSDTYAQVIEVAPESVATPPPVIVEPSEPAAEVVPKLETLPPAVHEEPLKSPVQKSPSTGEIGSAPTFDTLNPFGIEELSGSEETPSVRPAISHTRSRPNLLVPMPPRVDPAQPAQTRTTRSVSVADPTSRRAIPLPPTTTPAKVAPIVIPAVDTGDFAEEELREAEKRAKRERKEHEKAQNEDGEIAGALSPRSPRPVSMTPSSSTAHSEETSTVEPSPAPSASSSASDIRTTPEHKSSENKDKKDKMKDKEDKTKEKEEKAKEKEEKQKEKEAKAREKEREKEERQKEKEKDKEEKLKDKDAAEPNTKVGGGFLSKISDKLKGKKHTKDEEKRDSREDSLSSSGGVIAYNIDPPTPSVTPHDGVIRRSSTGSHITFSATGTPRSVDDLESQRSLLATQIRDLEDLHRRLTLAIALDHQSLIDIRAGRVATDSPTQDEASAPPVLTSRSSLANLRPLNPLPHNSSTQFQNLTTLDWLEIEKAPQNHFGFRSKLGEGPHGSVYVVQHLKLGFLALLRILRLPSECNASEIHGQASKLKEILHERFASVYAVSEVIDSEIWIFSQYCPIGSIRHLLDAHLLTLTEDQIRPIAKSLLFGLDYLHSLRMAHGSVTVNNILVDSIGDVKLADAQIYEVTAPLLTDSAAVHDRALQEPTAKGDLWGLGVSLIEMAESKASMSKGSRLTALTNTEKFSSDFADFIRLCVSPPEEEGIIPPTTSSLLNHIFITGHPVNTALVDGIAAALVAMKSRDHPEHTTSPLLEREEADSNFGLKRTTAKAPKVRTPHMMIVSAGDAAVAHSAASTSATSNLSSSSTASINQEQYQELKIRLDSTTQKALEDATPEVKTALESLSQAFLHIAESVLLRSSTH